MVGDYRHDLYCVTTTVTSCDLCRDLPRDLHVISTRAPSRLGQERTIILLVCPARSDLEADPAVELVKEVDPSGKRTVGVLTKVDLMNAGTDVANYLTNAVRGI